MAATPQPTASTSQPRIIRPAQQVRPQIRQREPRQLYQPPATRQEQYYTPPRFQQMRPPRPLRRLPPPPVRQPAYHEWSDPYASFGQQVYDNVSYGSEYYEPTQQYHDYSYDTYQAPTQQMFPPQPPQKRPRWQQRRQPPSATAPPPGRDWTHQSWEQPSYDEGIKPEVKAEHSESHEKLPTHSKAPIEISSGEEETTNTTKSSVKSRAASTSVTSQDYTEQYYGQDSYIDPSYAQYSQQETYEQYSMDQSHQVEGESTTQQPQLEVNQGITSGTGAEYEVGPGADDNHWFPPEYYVKIQQPENAPKKSKLAKTEYVRIMKARPWAGDQDKLDETLIAAP